MHKLGKGLRIVYRRLRDQGLWVTGLWVKDHALRLLMGMSPPATSRIAPNLYVGGQHYPRGLGRMSQLGISASLSLRREADDEARGVALEKHLWLPTTELAERLGIREEFTEFFKIISSNINGIWFLPHFVYCKIINSRFNQHIA